MSCDRLFMIFLCSGSFFFFLFVPFLSLSFLLFTVVKWIHFSFFQLLIELDGAEQRRGVFVIGATNR